MYDVAQEIAWELFGGYHSLPTEQQHQLRDLADKIVEALTHDDEFNEGVAETFRDEFLADHVLPSCGPELVAAIYEEACDTILQAIGLWGQSCRNRRDKAVMRRVYAKVREIKQDGPQSFPGEQPRVDVQLAAAKRHAASSAASSFAW